MQFRDRIDAGKQLAEKLSFLKRQPDVVVLGVPRGGVVVAAEVARALDAPLDVFVAHKIGAPFNPELAIGALTSTDALLDEDLIDELHLSREEIEREVKDQRRELERRLALFRRGRTPIDIAGKTAVLVDDGVATGSTVLASLRSLRKMAPACLVLAVPVGPAETIARLARECDRAIVLDTPEPFWAVGRFYVQFGQTSDSEVVALLAEAAERIQSAERHIAAPPSG
jgi:putative phosphoribosyl transferase